MKRYYDIASDEAKKEANKFINRIEKGILKKKILPNQSAEYPLDKAMKSFKNFTKSKDAKQNMENFYK